MKSRSIQHEQALCRSEGTVGLGWFVRVLREDLAEELMRVVQHTGLRGDAIPLATAHSLRATTGW